MNSVIVVKDLGKAYKRYPSAFAQLLEWFSLRGKKYHSSHWVLKDISFEVPKGQALGIIGVNGAGKSTLLKMLTGTTLPSSGSIQINGTVSALLELGIGFDEDFTGRQNAYISGQLLGLSITQLDELMPQIQDFAGIGDYLDQPIRVYSSGMKMRLAFSVATAVRPDILIIDEALSVGDVEFQHRSFSRIREFQKCGTTVLLVSHDKQMIMSVCDQAILLNNGKIEIQGDPEAVGNYYNAMLSESSTQRISQTIDANGKIKVQSGNGQIQLESIQLLNEQGNSVEIVKVGELVYLHISLKSLENIEQLVAGYLIKDRLGRDVFGTNTYFTKQQLNNIAQGENIRYQFSFNMNLGPGNYSVSVALHADEQHLSDNYLWQDHALSFTVVNVDKMGFVGVAWIPPIVQSWR